MGKRGGGGGASRDFWDDCDGGVDLDMKHPRDKGASTHTDR